MVKGTAQIAADRSQSSPVHPGETAHGSKIAEAASVSLESSTQCGVLGIVVSNNVANKTTQFGGAVQLLLEGSMKMR